MGLAEEVADFEELGLGAGSLRLRVDLPAMDEVGDGEGHGGKGSLQGGGMVWFLGLGGEPVWAREMWLDRLLRNASKRTFFGKLE
jgi:hypothetical protein